MLASRHGALSQTTKQAYVCLSCQYKAQQIQKARTQRRRQHTDSHSTAPTPIEDGSNQGEHLPFDNAISSKTDHAQQDAAPPVRKLLAGKGTKSKGQYDLNEYTTEKGLIDWRDAKHVVGNEINIAWRIRQEAGAAIRFFPLKEGNEWRGWKYVMTGSETAKKHSKALLNRMLRESRDSGVKTGWARDDVGEDHGKYDAFDQVQEVIDGKRHVPIRPIYADEVKHSDDKERDFIHYPPTMITRAVKKIAKAVHDSGCEWVRTARKGLVVISGQPAARKTAREAVDAIMMKAVNSAAPPGFKILHFWTDKGEDPYRAEAFADASEQGALFATRRRITHDDGKIMPSISSVVNTVSRQDAEHATHLKSMENQLQPYVPYGAEEEEHGASVTRRDSDLLGAAHLESMENQLQPYVPYGAEEEEHGASVTHRDSDLLGAAHLESMENQLQPYVPYGAAEEEERGALVTSRDSDLLGFIDDRIAMESTTRPRPSHQTASGSSAATTRSQPPSSGFAWQSAFSTLAHQHEASWAQLRQYHTSGRLTQQASPEVEEDLPDNPDLQDYPPEIDQESGEFEESVTFNPNGIRAQLRKWNELHGQEEVPDLIHTEQVEHGLDTYNNLTRLPDEATINQNAQHEDSQDQIAMFAGAGKEGFDAASRESGRFLDTGDLVEIEYPSSERESIIAVFVRRLTPQIGQFFTMNGRWMHLNLSAAQYSIPRFIDPKEIEPIMKYLPDVQGFSEMEDLRTKAKLEDLSVPRQFAAPLVAKLSAFYQEAQEIYRRHANALDNAHQILAHETDLRYGSLQSAAMALLKLPADRLPLTALFTVRKALVNGGFAFNVDRRSHRITGYMQIRSKEQVRMVEQVRTWIREWQDDLARTPGMNEKQAARHRPSKGAGILHSFVAKSKEIVKQQRKNRTPTRAHNVGPSKTRLPMESEVGGCLKSEHGAQFTAEEQDVVRFFEAWCCSHMFSDLPRIKSLPPLILHATGLYNDIDGIKLDIDVATGFLFLQELGVVMPWENRVRFDQHLLLPSSQHSKPLQNLMQSLLVMRDNHNLRDTMADLRHDWKDLPVYCVDDASAQEIDDGISIEPAGTGPDGQELRWLHVHIANPTAFFSRDHPLAKMARHMGETIYMPERTYMMLPRWVTQRHFSLGPDRPCLTFSAKLDSKGKTLEYKIRPGIVRNVIRLTYNELAELLGHTNDQPSDEISIVVGGTPPPPLPRKSRVADLTPANMEDFKALEQLTSQRSAIRRRAGGIFFATPKPTVSVWQHSKHTGLAWDNTYRKGSRTVHGDPVVEVRTQPFKNWFSITDSPAQILVAEAMLLCAEIAASYCADRNIPTIYRGSEKATDVLDPTAIPKAQKAQEMLNNNQEIPLYLGVPYIQHSGYTVLRTTPLKHNMLGMDRYAKVTSPLRRYGDMIIHWQIEAALRHEAETGKSLTRSVSKDLSFLPFSAQILETIMLGLQPREYIITRAKQYSEQFWQIYTLFHKFHFPEQNGGSIGDLLKSLDPTSDGETVRVFVQSRPEIDGLKVVGVFMMELNINVSMLRPEGFGLEESRQGDIWEAKLQDVDVFKRGFIVKPTRLVGREAM